MQLVSMFICNCSIAVTNKHTAKLHHIGSFYIYIFPLTRIYFFVRSFFLSFFLCDRPKYLID